MRTTNELMSQFGGHAKYVSFNFSGDKWIATFKSNADEHTETGNTIEDAMETLLVWYSHTKDPKHIAEKLHETLKGILNTTNNIEDSPRKIVENISKMCSDTLSSIETDNDGKIIFGNEFKQEKQNEYTAEMSESGTISCVKKSTQKPENKNAAAHKHTPIKRTESDDGLPLYFEVKTPSFMFVKCYGYDVDGNRVYINIDMQNYSNTAITTDVTLNKADFPEDMITQIAEDEFNSRYDEAAALIMNAKNYLPIDYSNVEILKD